MTAAEANEHPERLPFKLAPTSTAAPPTRSGVDASPT